jgi:YHS domain-containing protein
MKESRGYIIRTDSDGKAVVAIHMDSGKGCSAQTEHGHCAEAAPELNVKVLNKAGAAVGDFVSVVFKSGAILKSIAILIGLPGLGIVAGAVIAIELNGRSLAAPNRALFAGVACFAATVLAAVLVYRTVAHELQPFVDRIISTGPASVPFSVVDPVCGTAVNPLKAAVKIDYQGGTYYFCNAGCLDAFMKDPRRYLGVSRCVQCAGSTLIRTHAGDRG